MQTDLIIDAYDRLLVDYSRIDQLMRQPECLYTRVEIRVQVRSFVEVSLEQWKRFYIYPKIIWSSR